MALLKEGYLSAEELAALPGVPGEERLRQGPVAVLECAQEIPCNPCEEACRHGAIVVGEPITKLPVLDGEKCTGCGACIAECPGQAIFCVDGTYSEDEATVQLPYEYVPLPEKGELVDGLNRAGEKVCAGRVERVRNPKKYDHTPVITVAVPKGYEMEVRMIGLRRKGDG